MIPSFPNFKPIDIADRGVVEAHLATHPPLASEYTFTNLFAWRETYHYQLAAFGEGLLILKTGHDGALAFLQPLVATEKLAAVQACHDHLRRFHAAPLIDRVGEDFLHDEDTAAWPVTITEDRDNFDYIYSVPELVELKGDKYHDKKNLLNQFERNNPSARYLPLTSELVGRCLLFQHEWCDERDCESNEGLAQEMCAVYRILTHFEALDVSGAAIELDGRLVALTIAEALNPDTLVIHVEKGRANLTGIYQAINQQFLAHAGVGYPYVNREQDLGITGLRKAKQSFNPVRMVRKYRVTG
jgi:hypothetical protein